MDGLCVVDLTADTDGDTLDCQVSHQDDMKESEKLDFLPVTNKFKRASKENISHKNKMEPIPPKSNTKLLYSNRFQPRREFSSTQRTKK